MFNHRQAGKAERREDGFICFHFSIKSQPSHTGLKRTNLTSENRFLTLYRMQQLRPSGQNGTHPPIHSKNVVPLHKCWWKARFPTRTGLLGHQTERNLKLLHTYPLSWPVTLFCWNMVPKKIPLSRNQNQRFSRKAHFATSINTTNSYFGKWQKIGKRRREERDENNVRRI